MKSKEKNQGTDRRTRYTRNVIRESLLSMMRQKPFSKITVTEICKLSEINRGTFYLHYYDLDDVLDDIIDMLVQDTTKVYDHVMCPEKQDAPILFVRRCRKIRNTVFFSLMRSPPPASWTDSASCPRKISLPGSCRTASFPMNRRKLSCISR